jgi:hypothetical protein
VLSLIDYVLGSGESDTTEMSLGVAIREVMHRLNDVTQRKDVVNVTSNWISPAELLMMKSSGSSTSSPRSGATLTSVSANVNPYKESSLRDTPTSNLSRVDQLAKSVILASYFRDPTLTEHLLISALIKEWNCYTLLNIFVFFGSLFFFFFFVLVLSLSLIRSLVSRKFYCYFCLVFVFLKFGFVS